MIALTQVLPPRNCLWAIGVDDLPPPPASRYGGFIVRCGKAVLLEKAITWAHKLRVARPHAQIGLVVRAGDPSLLAALQSGIRFEPVVDESQLEHGRLPMTVLVLFRDHAVENELLAACTSRWHIAQPEAFSLASAVVAIGATGGRVSTLSRRLACSPASLYRQFENTGLPPPGELLAYARLESVRVRMRFGIDETAALAAAGWLTRSAYRKACARAHED